MPRETRPGHVCWRHGGSQGYSLAEMGVMVGIFGVVTLFAVGAYLRKSPDYLLERATTGLTSDLQSARMQAISEGLPVQIAFETAARRYTLWADRNTNGQAEAAETLVRTWDEAPMVTVTVSEPRGRFLPRGAFAASNCVWSARLSLPDSKSRFVYIFPSGQVRWSSRGVTL